MGDLVQGGLPALPYTRVGRWASYLPRGSHTQHARNKEDGRPNRAVVKIPGVNKGKVLRIVAGMNGVFNKEHLSPRTARTQAQSQALCRYCNVSPHTHTTIPNCLHSNNTSLREVIYSKSHNNR